MSIELQPTLATLSRQVRATDRGTPERLPLLADTQRILGGEGAVSPERRFEVAAGLEQWRYELLDECGPHLMAEDRRVADALDLAANELLRGDPRPPRGPRTAIQDCSEDDGRVGRATGCLDPGFPPAELSGLAAKLTREHFGVAEKGRPVLLYAPLYLSSYCANHCVYCGFRGPNRIERRHLSIEQAVEQAELLRARGIRHVLLVAGDFPRLDTTEYFAEIIGRLSTRGMDPAVEIAPQSTGAYARLARAGACGVTLYQETYNEELYALYHPRGSKASYDWRLEGLERAAEAGIRRLGLGILLGLADPREDLLAMVRHARYLESRFPENTLAFSLPRIHEAPEGFRTPYPVDDETFVRLYCTLRLAFPRAELVLSTREAAPLRNRLARICITQMSAGSSTIPGGYEDRAEQKYGRQFPVCDRRSVAEVAAWAREAGLTVSFSRPGQVGEGRDTDGRRAVDR